VLTILRIKGGGLFWESLDIDLSLDMIENYQRYPKNKNNLPRNHIDKDKNV
jgi:hypothetical protein